MSDKRQHGGKRDNAGRKPAPEPMERIWATVPRRYASFLRRLGDGSISDGVCRVLKERDAEIGD